MQFDLSKASLSNTVLMDKVSSDVDQGVRLHTSTNNKLEVARSWTDTENWQFSVTGLLHVDPIAELKKFEIQSYGYSKAYVKLDGQFNDLELVVTLERLGEGFAQIEDVEDKVIIEFLEEYMASTFNRTMTEKMFEEYAEDEDYFHWLIY